MKKLILTAAVALCAATASAGIEDVRIYINPGHGAFDAGSRPMGTVKHGANNAYNDVNNDTTNFFESNTNLQKGLALFHKLKAYGVKHEGTNALDLTQNLVMSRIQSGAAPAYIDYDNHIANPESDLYDRSLSEISAEVEFNNFDVFISIHSNAATEGTNTNFPLFLYRGTDAQEGNAGSISMSKACWPHLFGLGHQQWTSYSTTSMNVRGDHSFYGSPGTVKYPITDPDYVRDETDQFSVYYEGQPQPIQKTDENGDPVYAEVDTDGDGEADKSYPVYETNEDGSLKYQTNEDGSIFIAPDSIGYTGYLGVIKHGVPGFLAEGYFHTYQPARHRYMNWGVCHLEGEAYAKGLNDYFGWGKAEDKAIIYGVLRDKDERFTHEYYNPNVSTNDKFLPLNNAKVILLNEAGEAIDTCITDDEYNGVFIFRDLEPGVYSLNYEYDGYLAPDAEYTAQFTLAAGEIIYPEAFLRNETWTPPTKVYVNYPDSTAGKSGYSLFPNYDMKSTEISLLAEQLADKTVRRQLIRDSKLYVLALDEANEPYIYLADLANDTVMTLDMAPVVMGSNGRLKISDIALTADHVLIASGLSKTQYSEDYVDDGETRGSVNFYKWSQDSITALPDTCELWFSSDYSCNYFRGLLGRTIAYSGTLEDGTITTTCPHGTMTSEIGMRFAQFAIVEGQNTGVIRYDAWVAPPNEANFYPDGMSSDQDNFEMMISPLGENNFALDGDLIAPFEWNAEGEAAEPQVLGRNEAVSNVKANGTNYFRYAGKAFMVTPKINEEGKVCGIQLFDISEGFSAAKEIVLDGGEIEPVEYTYASAHGELALTLDAEDKTTDADMELYLVVDGKAYKFTITENYTTHAPADGGTANPFAYALKSEIVEGKTLSISYALNAAATDVNIIVKNEAGEEVASSAEGAKEAGTYTAEIAVDALEVGKYTWEVEVTGAVKEGVETFASYRFYHPRGVDVDNNMESPSFGNIYCTEGMTSASETYHSNTTTSGGLGLYAFTADMEPILNNATGKYGFNGGWALNYKVLSTKSAADLARVRVADDGRIFVTRMTDQGDFIMYAPSFEDLYTNNKFTSLFEGLTFDVSTLKYTDAEGNFMGASNLGFDVKGSGDDLTMVALSSNANQWSYVYSGASTDEYALGSAATLPVPTNVPALTGKYTIAPSTTNVDYDDRGGIWYCQYRGTPSDAQPGLVYINANGEEVYKDLVSRGGGGVRVSPDGTQIAVASSSANPKQFTVYDLVWSEDGTPDLRRKYVITHNIGTNVYDIAWDLAGNIYVCGNSGEYLKGFAIPRTEAFTTKAATQYGFAVSEEGISGIESIDTDNGVAPVYYNLQGIQVANPNNGIYIVKRGNKVTKEVVNK